MENSSTLTIPAALAQVAQLRAQQASDPALAQAVQAVKRVQCHRFRHSYADVLTHQDWGAAVQFFLTELYSDRDFSQRDAQFGRIAPTMQRLFPAAVVGVATALSHLHALSEQLDCAMGQFFCADRTSSLDESAVRTRYVQAWRSVARPAERAQQLALVQHLGAELAKLTRIPGLRTMLRVMRAPAAAAGLEQLQGFLELGFDTFAAMQRSRAGVTGFLAVIHERESAWVARLFDASMASTHSLGVWPELE